VGSTKESSMIVRAAIVLVLLTLSLAACRGETSPPSSDRRFALGGASYGGSGYGGWPWPWPDAGPDAGSDAGPGGDGGPGSGHPDAGGPGSGYPDGGYPDAGWPWPWPDAGSPDGGGPGSGQPDAGSPDGGGPGSGQPDAGSPDGGGPGSGYPDSGPGGPDGGGPGSGYPDSGPGGPDGGGPGSGYPDAGPGGPDGGGPGSGYSDAGPGYDAPISDGPVADAPHHDAPPGTEPYDGGSGMESWWKDTDGIDPELAGCHIEYTARLCGVESNPGRHFGELCKNNQVIVETNPDPAMRCHNHPGDIGHPYVVNCNDWCKNTYAIPLPIPFLPMKRGVAAASGKCQVVRNITCGRKMLNSARCLCADGYRGNGRMNPPEGEPEDVR
jgi:hypothetical protein